MKLPTAKVPTPARVVLAVSAAVGILAAAAAATVVTPKAFLLANKTSPAAAEWNSLPTYWSYYKDDPVQGPRLMRTAALCYGGALVAWGALVWGAGKPRRKLYGDAHFATAAEIRRTGLLNGDGLIVGRLEDGRYLMLSNKTQQFVFVDAPPRSGKGQGIANPNLLNFDGSVIALAIKGDSVVDTSGWRKECGQEVFVWAPFDEAARSHRYNPLEYVRKDENLCVSDLQTIAQIVYPGDPDKGDSATNFFASTCRNLFVALGLYLLETPELPRTLGQMLRLVTDTSGPLDEHLAKLLLEREKAGKGLSARCVIAFNAVLGGVRKETFGDVQSTFKAPLTPFLSPITDAACSANDFNLADVRRKRMSIYVNIPFEKLADAKILMNLFFQQAITINTRVRPADDKTLCVPCLVLLDEATAPGRIDILARSMGFLPEYDMRILWICQSRSQVSAAYGRDTAEAMFKAFAVKVSFAPNEHSDAKELSDALGTYTERIENTSRGHSSNSHGSSSSTNTSATPQRRPLMYPQELMELDRALEIVRYEGHPPILCKKAFWYEDPELAHRRRSPVDVPPLNLATFKAKVEQRVRPLKAGEGEVQPLPIEQIAVNTDNLPEIDQGASQEEIANWTSAMFDRFETTAAAPVEATGDVNCIEPVDEAATAPGTKDPSSSASTSSGASMVHVPGGMLIVAAPSPRGAAAPAPVIDLSDLDPIPGQPAQAAGLTH